MTGSTPVKRESGKCSRTEDGNKSGHFGTKAEELHQVSRPEGVNEEMLSEEAVPEFCSVSGDSVLQVVE